MVRENFAVQYIIAPTYGTPFEVVADLARTLDQINERDCEAEKLSLEG